MDNPDINQFALASSGDIAMASTILRNYLKTIMSGCQFTSCRPGGSISRRFTSILTFPNDNFGLRIEFLR